MTGRRAFFLFFVALSCRADPRLDALRATLVEMRGKPQDNAAPRGATAELTAAKHQLRDWAESRLNALPRDGDEAELAKQMNAGLRGVQLICGYDPHDEIRCPDWSQLGFLNPIQLRSVRGFLVLKTGFGIECGFDESAYIFSWSDEGWRRVWHTEQNTYTEKEYKPQAIVDVVISRYSKTNNYVVLTLGTQPWCTSSWRNVYYRAFRIGPDANAGPLVDGEELGYLVDPPMHGSVTRDEILVEFRVASLDAGVHNRAAVRHYRIDSDQAKRIDPLALSPRDFVEEWLMSDWREAAHWSESNERGIMRDAHQKKSKSFSEFVYPTMHCPATPDLWQVGIDFEANVGRPPSPETTYYLVRWRPPYRFSMVNVGNHPWPGCTEKDPGADEDRTLFPGG